MAEKQGRWGAWAQRLLCPATKSKKCLGSTWRTIVFKPWQCDYRLGVADRTQAPAGTNHDANWEGQGTPALDAEHSTSLHWCQIESWTWSFGWSRKNSFIALPGKGGHSGLLPLKTELFFLLECRKMGLSNLIQWGIHNLQVWLGIRYMGLNPEDKCPELSSVARRSWTNL